MGIGAAIGGASGFASGLAQHEPLWKAALDGVAGAAGGAAVGGIALGAGARLTIGAGAASSALVGGVQQVVNNGGFNNFNPYAVGIDAVLGGLTGSAGWNLGEAGVGNEPGTIGMNLFGGATNVACAYSGGWC
jgi:hypothetical protein